MSSRSEKERFIDIIKANKRIIFKVIYSYCKDPEERKDLGQEIVIQLWKSLKNYNDQYKISTWIYKIALNVAISSYRKDLHRKKNTTLLDEDIFQIADDDDLANEDLDGKTELLYRFINDLDEFNRAVIILYLEENSYREIAEILGITETNVGSKINRIKNKLRDYFSLVKN